MIYILTLLFIFWNGYANKVKVHRLGETSHASRMYHKIGRWIYFVVGLLAVMVALRSRFDILGYFVNPLYPIVDWARALLSGTLILYLSYFVHNAVIGKIMVNNPKYIESNKRMTSAYLYAMIGLAGAWLIGLLAAIAITDGG